MVGIGDKMKGSLKMNKKGFTLVELLAVIVVLAIIILVAMPAVMSAMDKARKNSLKNEANEIIKIAQTAYAEDVMNGKAVGGTDICYPIAWLKANGFLEKNDDNYHGGVFLKSSDNSATIYLTNGMYTYTGTSQSDLNKSSTIPGNYVAANNDDLDTCGGKTSSSLRSNCASYKDNKTNVLTNEACPTSPTS